MNQKTEVNETAVAKNAGIVCYCGLPEPFHDYTVVVHQTDTHFPHNPEEVELYPVTTQGNRKRSCRELLEELRGKAVLSDRYLECVFEDVSRFPEKLKHKNVVWLDKSYFSPKGREYFRYFFYNTIGCGWYLVSADSELSDGWFVAMRNVS